MEEVLGNPRPLLFTLALGAALVGGLVMAFSAQKAAPRWLAYIFWLAATLLIALGLTR
ncbi:hypothetical protein [Calidithermus timidus]|jgi:uncharacterized protein (DUF983 family)|uniref:hypothetical protein n=1 Tax=Calidithermus timidus TaxID=307124 RepID=UPI0003809F17|nr:hypothetical protein [Calidithermus timidus]